MNTSTVKTYETINNTYRVIKTVKTTYEQQQERRENFIYMAKQKLLGLALILIGIVSCIVLKDATTMLFTSPVGLLILLTKDHILN